jgi:uncharacterized protein
VTSTNRLGRETSPYLLQHAHNPVDWFAWGEEALSRARSEDKPILLSIGYSSCHWCHVMERESFEDPRTAELMNQWFVCIKVDREERPDVDSVYMKAVQALTGSGGWPLTAFLTPAGEPFYGGTYFPPEPRHGMPSFQQVLHAVADAYQNRRDDVTRSAREIGKFLEGSGPREGAVDVGLLDHAFRFCRTHFDAAHGGFGGAPKFPQACALELLLHHHARTGDPEALDMVLLTLSEMASGGIRDHLGGGVHRYTVDGRWLVPHFEKMLYDNALLLRLYTAAWQLGAGEGYAQVVREIVSWLIGDMQDPRGGFYSARDADSEGVEGKYYVWSPEELEGALGSEAARLFARVYDVTSVGNWEGHNILHLPHDVDVIARAEGIEAQALARTLSEARPELMRLRAQRVPPLRDEKVVASWNGLVLRALAESGAALREPAFVEAAEKGLSFILEEMRRPAPRSRASVETGGSTSVGNYGTAVDESADLRLLRVWTAGEAKIPAFLEDYAAIGNALISLHEATLDPKWLAHARWCCDRVVEDFWDDAAGCFYDTAKDAEKLVVRPRDTMDNATPSGNSLAAELLQRGGHIFGDDRLREISDRAIDSEAEAAKSYPLAFGRLLTVATRRAMKPVEVAVVGSRADARTQELVTAALEPWSANLTLVAAEEGETLPFSVPLLEMRGMKGGLPTAYVCSGYACREPVTDVEGLRAQLLEVTAPEA